MNPILEKWLAEKQAEKQAAVIKSRKEFLIKLGLVDPNKKMTVYKDVLGTILTKEEAKAREANGHRITVDEVNDALDLTDEEYNQVLAYAQPQPFDNEEPTDHELLQRISRHTGIVSTFLIVYFILSIILGIYLGIKMA